MGYDIVRDPMYKYSQSTQDNFFKIPCLAFIFMWYTVNPDAQDFAKRRYDMNPAPEYAEKMKKVLQMLSEEAYKNLKEHSQHTIPQSVEVADSYEAQCEITQKFIPKAPIEHEMQLHDKLGLRRPFKFQADYT